MVQVETIIQSVQVRKVPLQNSHVYKNIILISLHHQFMNRPYVNIRWGTIMVLRGDYTAVGLGATGEYWKPLVPDLLEALALIDSPITSPTTISNMTSPATLAPTANPILG